MPALRSNSRSAAADPYGIGRTISPDSQEKLSLDNTRAGAEASNMEDGRANHHRFSDDDEQGSGNYRSSLAFWIALGSNRRADSPGIHHPFHDRIPRWVSDGATVSGGHAPAHSVRPDLSGPGGGQWGF